MSASRVSARLVLSLVGAAVVAASCDPSQAFNGVRVDPPFSKSTVTWERPDGTPYNIEQQTAGRVTLLYFGYTHCPEVCPMQLANLATALRNLGPDTASQVRVVFITLDPARDTGAVLTTWLRVIHPDFIALRGTLAAIDSELARLKLAPPNNGGPPKLEADPAHASVIVAYSIDGLAHFVYPEGVNPEAWEYDLRKLVAGGR